MVAKRKTIEVSIDLRCHPKLIATAKMLEISKIHLEGHLVNLWSGAMDYADDGDLWRGSEEGSFLFFESLAEIPSETERFLDAFRRNRWLDGWLIHDWLDHNAKSLVACYSSHNRERLVEIYAKHDRIYGRNCPGKKTTSQGKWSGSEREEIGESGNLPLITPNPKPLTLNPYTPEENKKENPRVGLGGKTGELTGCDEPRASFSFVDGGSRVKGCAYRQDELIGDGLSHKDVFEAFLKILVTHGIMTLESFFERVKRCKVTPAAWMILYLDKIHAVFRDRNGTTMFESEEADPVGMTMAGLNPGKGKLRHFPTEAARILFFEIMMAHLNSKEGGKSKWSGRISGPSIALELDRRKGKAGKIA